MNSGSSLVQAQPEDNRNNAVNTSENKNNIRLTLLVNRKIDPSTISVSKFNLAVCDKKHWIEQIRQKIPQKIKPDQDLKMLCLPIFEQDILESFNKLEIYSDLLTIESNLGSEQNY